MFLWTIVEYLLIISLAVLIISQMIYPAFSNKRTFWLFRKNTKQKEEVETRIYTTQEQIEINALQNTFEKLKSQSLKSVKKGK